MSIWVLDYHIELVPTAGPFVVMTPNSKDSQVTAQASAQRLAASFADLAEAKEYSLHVNERMRVFLSEATLFVISKHV